MDDSLSLIPLAPVIRVWGNNHEFKNVKGVKDYTKYFSTSIGKNFPNEVDQLIAQTEKEYKVISTDTQFASTSSNPLDKRLDFSAYFLALIKTLDEKGESFETIRRICLEIVTEYVKPKNKIHQLLKKIPAKLTNTWLSKIVIRLLNKRLNHNSNPNGFVATFITDKQKTFGLGYGIDILECGICKLFNKHNYQKYAPVLCEVDKITSGLAGLKLIRTGTIANGAMKCDFRFKKEET
jgi:hypothetical protein